MADVKLPPGVLEERILGMEDAEGNPTDNEADAVVIRVEQLREDGEVTTTEVIKDPVRP